MTELLMEMAKTIRAPKRLLRKDRRKKPRRALPVRVAGKFFAAGDEKIYVKGVTYGPFKPEADGCEYHTRERVERDFAKMAASGINTVRVYTVPPRWLLDAAAHHGLRVMVGIPWQQHVAFLDDAKQVKAIEGKIREGVLACAGHPAVFGYALGNEIPSDIVRWHGAKKIEKFIKRLYGIGKAQDPSALFTYVNFPTTEYLQLPFLDFVCFNVYLEDERKLESYLYRLQNQAGDKPLLMAELGLDSRRNGEQKQAEILSWQIRCAFRTGAAGLFVFSWTDEWFRGGHEIDDWDFGLTTRERNTKLSLDTVASAYRSAPFAPDEINWPRVSVVVCTYNGSRTIADCLDGISKLKYPDLEVIIVNDGSKDHTLDIINEYAGKFGFRVISTENRGLSNARNTGMEASTGEIVAYTDDDARPDPHWLHYLASDFARTDYAAIGGPNIPPPGDGEVAECVGNSPGGPAHVLFSDREAEHIPGCNMAYRKSALLAVGGFNPIYRQAGDDVDLCWRIMERGWKIGFSPSAMVWHHRRNCVKTYWKQQYGYGKAEALLEDNWPGKFNGPGHLTWTGRIYNKGLTLPFIFGRSRIYQGVWGSAPFQSIYKPTPGNFSSMFLMPEWYLLILLLAATSALSLFWQPLRIAVPLLALAVGVQIGQAVITASGALYTDSVHRLNLKLTRKLKLLTAFLHLMQPVARLTGRLDHGLTMWRRVGPKRQALPFPGSDAVWTEAWKDPNDWRQDLGESLKKEGYVVAHGGDYDSWDLQIISGMFGKARVEVAVEEHGAGRQYCRFRWKPQVSRFWAGFAVISTALAVMALLDHAWLAGGLFLGVGLLIGGRMLQQSSCAIAGLQKFISSRQAPLNAAKI